MSDVTPVNGAAPTKVRKAATKAVKAAPKVVRKLARTVGHKAKAEASDFAAEADEAREKLIAAAIHHARVRREVARRWVRDQAGLAGEVARTRPLTAIAAALGVGIIIGLLAAR
jgi:ElaB/YqjD/DUF883 family membrane-anchored ribosome-binding protein